MSRSPKKSRAEIQKEQRKRIEREQEKRRKKAEIRRKEEEKRLQLKRHQQAVKQMKHQLSNLAKKAESYKTTKGGEFVAEDLESLIQKVNELQKEVEMATSLETINLKEASLENAFSSIVAEGEAALLHKGLAQEEGELHSLEHSITKRDQELSIRFDREGLQRLRSLLNDARGDLKKKQLPSLKKKTAALKRELKEHQKRVNERHQTYLIRRSQVENLLSAAEDQVAVLKEDEVAMYWAEQEIGYLSRRLQFTKSLLTRDEFEQVESICQEIKTEIEALLEESNAKQLQEKKRLYILDGIMSVMEEMGFVIQSGYPELENYGDPKSSIILHANRVGGGGVSVSIPQEGDIWYDVDGFPMRVEYSDQGEEMRSCDEAEEQIEAMHQVMEESFGITMSELTWEGKDPNQLSKAADELPKGDQSYRGESHR